MNRPIKILLVDDHPIVRSGLNTLISAEPDMIVCGEASSAEEALGIINRDPPDLIIVDISLEKGANGIDLLRAVKERFSSVVTLVLSLYDESYYAERAIRAGARGYVQKNKAPSVIVNAIRDVMNGELYLGSEISKRIIDRLLHGSSDYGSDILEQLSNREFEVFQLLGNGFSTREMAKKLNVSHHTIDSHRRNIKEKLRIRSNNDLIRTAVQWVVSENH